MKKWFLVLPILIFSLLVGGYVLAGNNGAVFTKTNYTDPLETMIYNNCDNIGCGSWGDISLSFYKADGTFITDINHIDYNTPYTASGLDTILNNPEVGQVLLGLDSDLANSGCFANYSFPLSTCRAGLDGNGINYYLSNLTFSLIPPPIPPEPYETALITLGNSLAYESTGLATSVFSNYWPFILVISILLFLIAMFTNWITKKLIGYKK
jgi:hypothetical protein